MAVSHIDVINPLTQVPGIETKKRNIDHYITPKGEPTILLTLTLCPPALHSYVNRLDRTRLESRILKLIRLPCLTIVSCSITKENLSFSRKE